MKSGGLNPRLLCAAGFVRQGATFADVGTDHAYLPLFLLGEGRIVRAVCTDINKGPLESARRNAEACGMTERCEFILTDGAAALSDMNITDYAICGMGGELIADIIERAPHLAAKDVSLILQPMSRQSALRKYLAAKGFDITAEGYSKDAGKYYVCMLVRYSGAPRPIDDAEAEISGSNCKIVNKDAQIGYLEAKYNAISRAVRGKKNGGGTAEAEEHILRAIDEKIRAVRKELT